jgi:hypothetical protein
MARSTYIYLMVVDGKPYAAFTVKHELETYLDHFEENHDDGEVEIFRLRDNPIHNDKDPEDITDQFYE